MLLVLPKPPKLLFSLMVPGEIIVGTEIRLVLLGQANDTRDSFVHVKNIFLKKSLAHQLAKNQLVQLLGGSLDTPQLRICERKVVGQMIREFEEDTPVGKLAVVDGGHIHALNQRMELQQ